MSGTYETSDVDRMAYISSMFDVKIFETMYHHKLPFNSKDSTAPIVYMADHWVLHPSYMMLRLFRSILQQWYYIPNLILTLQTCRIYVNSLKQICMFMLTAKWQCILIAFCSEQFISSFHKMFSILFENRGSIMDNWTYIVDTRVQFSWLCRYPDFEAQLSTSVHVFLGIISHGCN
jgi:hypothetical protein